MTSIQAQEDFGERSPVVYSKPFYESNDIPSDTEPDEYSPLLSTSQVPGSLYSPSGSSLTDSDVSAVEKQVLGSKDPEMTCYTKWCNKRWRSIYVMYFTMFLSAVTFSIVLSSIWPYLLQVDYTHASTSFLGWVVAAYSFGQLVASPVFGFWADKRPTREPLLVALVLNVLFSLLYCYIGAIPAGVAGYILIVARAMVGFGAGIAAVVRSYVSEATTEKERTGAMAGVSSSQALGFILGPALGLAFVPLGSEGLKIDAIRFHFNMYTGPGYLSALMGVINIILLVFFREAKLSASKRSMKEKDVEKMGGVVPGMSSHSSILIAASSEKPISRKYFDRLAAAVAIILFFVILFVFAVFETIAAPLSLDEFAWRKQESILYNNAFFAGLAVLAIVTFIGVKFVSKKIDERVVLMAALFVMAFGYFTLLPMGDTPPQVAITCPRALVTDWVGAKKVLSIHVVTVVFVSISVALDVSTAVNSSAQDIITIQNSSTLEVVGCRDPPQKWCPYISKIYLVQYVLSLALLAIGYPAANLISYSIYSKILGPFPQGTMMGILTAAGSLARAVGPMCVTALYQHFGPTVTFASVDGLIVVAIILLLVMSRRLRPYGS